jgi:small acid-soluble spore protein D (minor alpha/beta-type SASP)
VYIVKTVNKILYYGETNMSKRNKILVPEAKKGLDELKANIANSQSPDSAKFEVAEELGVPLKKGYNGGLTSHQAGKVGGKLGGGMVRELVKMAQQNLSKNGPH